MTENYIRPPIVALEPGSHRVAAWRFRLILLLLLAAVAVGVFFMARAIIDAGEGSDAPGVVTPTSTPTASQR